MLRRDIMLVVAGVLASAVVLAAPDPERRLDARLKVLQRARASGTAVSAGQVEDLVARLSGRAPRAASLARARESDAEPRLLLLLRYVGDRARLEASGFATLAKAGNVYTGTLAAGRVSDLLSLPDVQFVQLSQPLRATEPAWLPAPSSAPPIAVRDGASRPPSSPSAVSGAGALVAFVDTGVDIFHQDFRNGDGTTRIKYLLDLSDPGDTDGDGALDGGGPSGGTLYTEAQINAALQSLGSVAEKDTTGHGSHGLSIATGDDPALPGLAPAADLIVVKATREDGTLGFESADVVSALAFVDEKAAELGLPYVVNLSLGTLFSSHDGRSLEELAIDALVGPGVAGKAVVVAAGNSAEHRSARYHHLGGTAQAGIATNHTLTLPSYTASPGRGNDRVLLDLWSEGRDRLTLTLTGPGCEPVSAAYGEYADVATPCGDVFIANLGGANPMNGDTEALLLIDDWSGTPPSSGSWTLTVTGEATDAGGEYHGWLADESLLGATLPYLSSGADNLMLVGKPGGAVNAITVGSFAKHDAATRFRVSWTDVNGIARSDTSAVAGDISDFSSTGFTRDGRVKPELVAPGERVLGAVSQDAWPGIAPNSIYRFHPFAEPDALITDESVNHGFGLLQGTSFSAPVVTGLVARILSTNPALDAVEIRNVLINSALADAFTGSVPNALWGYGKADLAVGGAPLPGSLRITTDTLPDGAVNEPYTQALTASGGTLPYTWSLASGALPAGLNLDATGLLAGTPTVATVGNFTLQVTASAPAQSDTRAYTLTVTTNPPLHIVTNSFPVARLDKAYSEELEAKGGTPPYSWSLAGGSLPQGLSLDPQGRIDGTPAALGRYDFTLSVQDANQAVASRSMKIKVTGQGGDAWTPLGTSTPVISQIAVDPNDPDHLACITSNNHLIFETTNGGDSWRPISINNGYVIHNPGMYRTPSATLRFAPLGSSLWVRSESTNIYYTHHDLFRFDPQTSTWLDRTPGYSGGGSDVSGARVYDFDRDDTLYLAAEYSFYRVLGDGAIWELRGPICAAAYGPNPLLSLSIFRRDPSYMYDSKCATEDGGWTWLDVLNGSAPAFAVAVSQLDRFDAVKASGDFVERTTDGGRNWSRVAIAGGSLGSGLDRSLADPAFVLHGGSAGLFRSTNGGQTWGALPINGLQAPVSAIAIDPGNTDSDVLYTATDQGLYRTSDGGHTWSLKSDGLVRRSLSGLAFSPQQPSELLLLSGDGPYLTRTAGERWTLSNQGLANLNVRLPVISAANPDLYLLATDDGVFRSDNRGVTWVEPNPSFDSGFSVVALDADPFDAGTILTSLSGSKGSYRSTDRGVTWSPVNSGLPLNEPRALAFARDVSGRVYIALDAKGIYRSNSTGGSWSAFGLNNQTVNGIAPAPSNSEYVYAASGATVYYRPGSGAFVAATTSPAHDVLSLAVDPATPLVAYAGVDHPGTAGETGGLYKTIDGGQSWTRMAGTLDAFDVVGVATHPSVSGTLYVATREGGAYRSTDGGARWASLDTYGTVADLTTVNVQDPSNPFLLFAGTEGYGVQASTDKGRTYVPRVSGLGNLFVNAIAFDPDDPSILYAGSDAGVFKSTDSGSNWSATALGSGEVRDVITDNEGLLRRVWATVTGIGVAFSADGGATFTVYNSGLESLDLTSLELEAIGLLRRVWATTHGGSGVAHSDDLGQTWKPAGGNGLTSRDINDLIVETGALRRVWATTDDGVFFTDDAGLSWTDLSLGLPSGVPATSLAIDPSTGEALVSLFAKDGGGVYRGGNLTGLWTPFSEGLEELRVRRLTHDGGHTIDGSTSGATFFASTAGDGVYAAELRAPEGAVPMVTSETLADAFLHIAYAESLTVSGGLAPYAWSLIVGTLPPGLALDSTTGAIAGEPAAKGLYAFTAQVADARRKTAQRELEIQVLDPDTPALSITDVTIVEGNAGTANAVFSVTLAPASAQSVTVSYATLDGTAAAGSDYTATSGVLSFAPSATLQTLAVTISGDTEVEANETLQVRLSWAVNAALARSHGVGTILDDELPVLAIAGASQTEGDGGTTGLVFTAALSAPASQPVTVDWATADGTATAGEDYVAGSGQLSFAIGTSIATLAVPAQGDVLDEPDETFSVVLSAVSGAALADATAVGTIQDDDPQPALSIADASVRERYQADATAVFVVTLDRPSSRPVTISYATADQSATAGSDYTAASGTLSFAPGVLSRTIPITVADDTANEGDETFLVQLSGATNASLPDAQAIATIDDDEDEPPRLSIAVVRPVFYAGYVYEGDGVARFNVVLDRPTHLPVSVDYATSEGSGGARCAWMPASGTVSFAPEQTIQTLGVTLIDNHDGSWAGDFFEVLLTNPVNAAIDDGVGEVSINNDDGMGNIDSILAIYDATLNEGHDGVSQAVLTVRQCIASGYTVSVSYATADGTAVAGSDYVATSGTVVFAPGGPLTQTVAVPVIGDRIDEDDEAFYVDLVAPFNGRVVTGRAIVTIRNDDTPQLTVTDVSLREGDSGWRDALFRVSLSAPSGRTVRVDYTTADGTADAGADYRARSGHLAFAPGRTWLLVGVPVRGDRTAEPDETFGLDLSNPDHATLGDAQGVAAILDDDTPPPPSLSIKNVTVREPASGVGTARFSVLLNVATTQTVSVDYATADGTAVAGSDYQAVSGTLTFTPGARVRTITVPILSDSTPESRETFVVNLTAAVNAGIGDAGATGSIVDRGR